MDIDPMQLLECTRDALTITKQTTKIIRQAWDQRHTTYRPLLALSSDMPQSDQPMDANLQSDQNQLGAQSFIDQLASNLNKQDNLNTLLSNDEQVAADKQSKDGQRKDISEAELIGMIKQNKQ